MTISGSIPSPGNIIGHADVIAELEAAVASSKLHHGWMFSGPRGIGKAKVASLFAAALLNDQRSLEHAPDARASHLMETGAHPDFLYLSRPIDEKGKIKSDIPVETIRKLSRFFSLRPAMGGWRIAVIDSIDDLNASSANALLKTLEEPPERSLLILISHGEKSVLPTIKSRCRKVRFNVLNEADSLSVLTQNGVSDGDGKFALSLVQGRPGTALSMLEKDPRLAVDAMRRATQLRADAKAVKAAMNTASRSESAFSAAVLVLENEILHAARRENTAIAAGDWAVLYSDVQKIGSETKSLNQDKAQAIASALLQFQKQMRSHSSV